jgi:hypothetical protein
MVFFLLAPRARVGLLLILGSRRGQANSRVAMKLGPISLVKTPDVPSAGATHVLNHL